MAACVAIVVYLPLVYIKQGPNKDDYSLIECSGISKCEDLGVFHSQETCYNMRDRLNKELVIFLYECERVNEL